MRQFEMPVKLMGAKLVGFLITQSQREYVVLSLTIVIVLHKSGTWFPQVKTKSNIQQIRHLFYLYENDDLHDFFPGRISMCNGFCKKRIKQSSGQVCHISEKWMKVSIFSIQVRTN